MKKSFFGVFSLLSVYIVCVALGVAAQNDTRVVRVGVYENSPKVYKNTDGSIGGFWADITDYIAEQENWNLEYVYGTWDEGLLRLENGEIDIMVDVAVTEERRQRYDFNTETALLSWSVIYTREGFDIKSFRDLEGKKIAVIQSSVHYTAPLGIKNVLSSFGVNSEFIDVANMEDVFARLDANEADAGVVNWHFGILNESKYKVNRTGLVFNPSELNFALTKNDPDNPYLIGALDLRVRELKDDPNSIYFESIKTHFRKSLGEIEVLPTWLKTFLAVLCVFLVLVLAGIFLARRYQQILEREIEEKIHDIREKEEKFTAVVNQAQDAIIVVQDGVIRYANKAIRISGYTDAEVTGKLFIDFIASEEQKRVSDTLGGAGSVFKTRLIHKNGSILDVEISSGTITFERKQAVLVILRGLVEGGAWKSG